MSFDLSGLETATFGHFLDQGFMANMIQALVPATRVFGPVLTVRLPGRDGTALVHALSTAEPGEIIVVDRCGDTRHACWGAVTTAAAQARGVAGVVIDGFVTDRSAILEAGFPVWCRGQAPLTTKIRGAGGAVGGSVTCGGVRVGPADIVLADENGVVVLAPETIDEHAAQARAMQAAEPETIRRLRNGETLASITDAPPLPRSRHLESSRTETPE